MQAEGVFGHSEHDNELLFAVATPRLYRVNAFRVLGLPVTVDGVEMNKQQKKLKMLEKLGAPPESETASVLRTEPPPDADAIRQAGQRLHDMRSRLIDELFWFWPLVHHDHGADEAFGLLQRGDVTGAYRVWSAHARNSGNGSISRHNLAVLHHALALDMEERENQDGRPSDKREELLKKHWPLALRYWAATIEDDETWRRLTDRAEGLDDPRLTTGFVRRLRQSLPHAIVSISIGLAVRAAKRGHFGRAERHCEYIRASGLDVSLADRLLDHECSPIVEQVRRICEPIADLSKSDRVNSEKLARKVLQDCQPLLAAICSLLGKAHHLRQAVHNTIASAVRGCMIDYGNETEDWGGCLPMLQQATALALDEELRTRLQDDIAHVTKMLAERENLKKQLDSDRAYEVTLHGAHIRMANACVCCLASPTAEQTVSHSWEEVRGITRYKRTLSFSFPICQACLTHQHEYSRKRWLLGGLTVGISTLIMYLIATQISRADWLEFVAAGAVLSLAVSFCLSAAIRLCPLPDEHACRSDAVEITDASEQRVVFRFHNPLYAKAFASFNHMPVQESTIGKPPRGWYILSGIDAVLLLIGVVLVGVVAHWIVYGSMQEAWKYRPQVSDPPTLPASFVPDEETWKRPSRVSDPTVRRQAESSYSAHEPPVSADPAAELHVSLRNRIDTGRANADALSTELSKMDSQLETLSSRLAGLKVQADNYGNMVQAGGNVDGSAYQEVIDTHNRLVKEYNALLATRKRKYAEYESEVNSVNDMVRRYNRGDR